MLANFLGVMLLLGSALLLTSGLGIIAFALARGDRHLAGRALAGTSGFALAYLLATVLSAFLVPRRVLPVGAQLAFCGFDCHLHVSVVASELDKNRLGIAVQVRSDAKQAPEYPHALQFRLVGSDNSTLTPDNEARPFSRILEAGESYVDSLYFTVPPGGTRYSLQVIYPGLIDALLLGPANSRAQGKTTLSLGGAPQ